MKAVRRFRFVTVAAALLLAAPTLAQSAKSTVQVSDTTLLGGGGAALATPTGWVPILSSSLHVAQWKDLVIGVSLEAGLFTDTLVKSKGGKADTSYAEAMIEIRVLVDGEEAAPGSVVFARRAQTLMAKFGGVLNCSDADGDGAITLDECTLTDEELQLVLDTMGAHAFNFVIPDLASGDHTIVVEAKLTTDTHVDTGSADARAVIGKGSVVVDEVQLVKNLDISL